MALDEACRTHTCVQTSCTKILSTPVRFQRFKQPLTMQHQSTMMQIRNLFKHNYPQGKKNNWLLVPGVAVDSLLRPSLNSQDSVRKKNLKKGI